MAPRFRPHPPEVRAAALERYAAGEGVADLARSLGVARSRVIAWLQAAGVYQPRRASTRPARRASRTPAAPTTTTPATTAPTAPLRLTLRSGAVVESWDGAELGALLAVLDG